LDIGVDKKIISLAQCFVLKPFFVCTISKLLKPVDKNEWQTPKTTCFSSGLASGCSHSKGFMNTLHGAL
jgi:hypothetical protein